MDSPESQIADPIFDKFAEYSEAPSTRNESATSSSKTSPPESPPNTNAILGKTELGRARVRQLAASLSLEEQVSLYQPRSSSSCTDLPKVSLLVAADFWRSRAIPSKGVPAFKTTDGPNGARGGIFTGGTKVSWIR
jgi:beta-glucosidase